MKTRIKNEGEKKELTFELTRDKDGNIEVRVNGQTVVQFVNESTNMNMFTNFQYNYDELNITKQ